MNDDLKDILFRFSDPPPSFIEFFSYFYVTINKIDPIKDLIERVNNNENS